MFFTHVLRDRRTQLLTEHVDLLRSAYAEVKTRRPFMTRAIVVLPDHFHCIWQLPENDSDYPLRWRLIKTRFSIALRARGVVVDRGSSVWQRRYWEHHLRDDDDVRAHVDYIHINPLKHGLVAKVADWPHSSFHRYVALGRLARDWGGSVEDIRRPFGE